MYLSIRDNLLFDNFDSPLAGMEHLGVSAVEIELHRDFQVNAMNSKEKTILDSDEAAQAYAKHLDLLGIQPVSFLTACDFSAATPSENAAWMARAVELASILGMGNIRVDSHMSKESELDFGTRVRIFSDTLREVIDRTAGISVTLGIENHGFQGNNLAFQLNVYQEVGSTRLGATMDTGNFYWRGYPLSEVYGILRVLAPYAKHTHVKNIQYPENVRETMREGGWEYMQYVSPIEEGDIDHGIVLKLLKEANYQGDFCLEDESLHHFAEGEERVKVLERDVAHMKALLAAV